MDDLELAAHGAAATNTGDRATTAPPAEAMTYRQRRDAEAAAADGGGDDEGDDGRASRRPSRTSRYKARIERLEAEIADLRGDRGDGGAGDARAAAGTPWPGAQSRRGSEAPSSRQPAYPAGPYRPAMPPDSGAAAAPPGRYWPDQGGSGAPAMPPGRYRAQAPGRAPAFQPRGAVPGQSWPGQAGRGVPTRPPRGQPVGWPDQAMAGRAGYPSGARPAGATAARAASPFPPTPPERAGGNPFDPEAGAVPAPEAFPDAAGREAVLRAGMAPDPVDPARWRATAAAGEKRESLARDYAAKQDHIRTELPDYDRVVGAARMPVSNALAAALVESEHTARLEYHLAKSPEKLAELNRMSPREAARAVGRLEAVIAGVQPRSTRAPAPLAPLRGGAAGQMRSLAELAEGENAADYIELRRAQRRT